MKTSIAFTLALLTLTPLGAHAGGGNGPGNGGGAMVCRNPLTGKVDTAMLYDFWEARERWGIEVERTNSPDEKTQAIETLKRLAPTRTGYTLDDLKLIWKKRSTGKLSQEVGLEVTGDTKPVIKSKDPNCKFEQVANYTLRGELLVDSEIDGKFTETDRAGLAIHEMVYKELRRSKDFLPDSERARRMTATAFSKVPYEPYTIWPHGTHTVWSCFTERNPPAKVQAAKKHEPRDPHAYPKLDFWAYALEGTDRFRLVFENAGDKSTVWSETLDVHAIFFDSPKEAHHRQMPTSKEALPEWESWNGAENFMIWNARTSTRLDDGEELVIRRDYDDAKYYEIWLPLRDVSAIVRCKMAHL